LVRGFSTAKSYFLSSNPATKAAMDANSHSIRHS
jgi:hypothetical protein